MRRDTSVTVTRDVTEKNRVTFAVSHGTPSRTRPDPTQPLLKLV